MTRSNHGFTLLEALFGLLLIGVAMLLTMALIAEQPRIERRLAAHREALRLLEMELERLRSGPAVPADGELDLTGLPRSAPPAALGLRIFADAEALPERSLYEIELTARYLVGGRTYEQRLRSMIWTPP